MRMRFVVFVGLFLLLLSGCGGGGGGGSVGGAGGGEVTSETGIVNSAGGTITLEDGAQATFDADVVTGTTTVSVTRTAAGAPAEGEPIQVSPSYSIEVPVANLSPPDSETSAFAKGITLTIPAQGDLTGNAVNALAVDSRDAYKFVRVTIEYDASSIIGAQISSQGVRQKMKLAASYAVSAGKATVHITQDSLAAAASLATAPLSKMTIKVEVVDTFINFLHLDPALYGANSSTDFMQTSSPVNLYGRIPVILIHGWQGGVDYFSKEPHKDAWKNFIDYYYADPDLRKYFMLFSYRYDTDRPIDDNAVDLAQHIEQIFPGAQQVILIGHSMGGLVAHAYLQKHNGLARVRKLITLGTPYHGSPVVQAAKGLVKLLENTNSVSVSGTALTIDAYLTLGTPGTLDLAWDDFDHNPLIFTGNAYLQGLNEGILDLSSYIAFAGVMNPDDTHSISYNGGSRLLMLLGYGYDKIENDGVVPAVSALNKGYSSGFVNQVMEYAEDNYDHTQMHDGRENYDVEPLFFKIKNQLLTTLSTFEKTYGPIFQKASSVQVTPDGGFVVAGFSGSSGEGDICLLRTDGQGNVIWQKTFGGADIQEAHSVQITPDGGFIAAGASISSLVSYESDVYLLRTDSQGSVLWQKTFGGAGYQKADSVQVTPDGGFIVAGEAEDAFGHGQIYLLRTDSQGNVLWQKAFGGGVWRSVYSVRITSDGGFIVAGDADVFGGSDVYLLRTDGQGNLVWLKSYGGPRTQSANSVQITSDGGFIVAGTADDTSWVDDVYLLRTDSQGNVLWEKNIERTGFQKAYSAQITPDGGFIVAGETTAPGAEIGAYLLRTDSQGNVLWEKTFGKADYAYAKSVQVTPDGGFIVAGANDNEAYLIRTDGQGNVHYVDNPVIPVIAQTPYDGYRGTTFVRWGTGFTPFGTATLHLQKPEGSEYPTQTINLDSIGHFEINYTVPSGEAFGLYHWWATDNVTGSKSNTVTYAIKSSGSGGGYVEVVP